jgi:hypothetical protein
MAAINYIFALFNYCREPIVKYELLASITFNSKLNLR